MQVEEEIKKLYKMVRHNEDLDLMNVMKSNERFNVINKRLGRLEDGKVLL